MEQIRIFVTSLQNYCCGFASFSIKAFFVVPYFQKGWLKSKVFRKDHRSKTEPLKNSPTLIFFALIGRKCAEFLRWKERLSPVSGSDGAGILSFSSNGQIVNMRRRAFFAVVSNLIQTLFRPRYLKPTLNRGTSSCLVD